MALTIGDGPFGSDPAGEFNFEADGPAHTLYVERSPKKVRAVVAGRTVAESTDVLLMHETGLLPVYYFPPDDVSSEFLKGTDHHTHCPFKGDADYFSVIVDGDVRENAAWTYPDPLDGCPAIDDHVAFDFHAVDQWWEEAERIGVHPRDPYHRVDVIDTDRHVTVQVGGATVADSERATMLFESGLPPRFYVPEIDVDSRYLEPSETRTSCPYKGTTSRYYHVAAGGDRAEDVAWVYDEPRPEAIGVAGKVAFYNEHVDLVVDGQPWDRPDTRFS